MSSFRYLGYRTSVGEGVAKGGGATGWVEGTSSRPPRDAKQVALFPALKNGTPCNIRLTYILGINPLPLSGYLTFLILKGLRKLPLDFPITQVTWAAAPCLKTWEINKSPKQFLSLCA